MSLDRIIPIERQKGNKYIFRVSEFKCDIDIEIDVPIVDIQFLMIERDDTKSALSELIFVGKELLHFLMKNDVILYYYCDNVDMPKSKNHSNISSQEFRYTLFDRLFDWFGDESLIKDDIIINEGGGHYISLISKKKNRESLTKISNVIEQLNDK